MEKSAHVGWGEWKRVHSRTRVRCWPHTWSAYVRPGPGEGPLTYISKVVFLLHESFPDRVRTVEAPGPFEVTETGWGEFTVHVDVHFLDTSVEAFSTCHIVRLHPRPPTHRVVSVIPSVQRAQVAEQDACKTLYSLTPVVAELHEEFMFSNPSAVMLTALGKQKSNKRPGELVELETAMLASLRETTGDAVTEGVVIASQIANAEKELAGICDVLRKRIGALEKLFVTN